MLLCLRTSSKWVHLSDQLINWLIDYELICHLSPQVLILEQADGRGVELRSYILPNEPVDEKIPLEHFLVPIEMVERASGLLFVPNIIKRTSSLQAITANRWTAPPTMTRALQTREYNITLNCFISACQSQCLLINKDFSRSTLFFF